MTVVSRSGAACTVNRAQGGTTAAAHAAGTYLRNDWIEGIRDLTLHPNYRIAHYDALAFFQAAGVSICIPSSLDQEWSGGNAWSDYHAIAQPPGMGDGSDGKANNLLCLARRGQANSKAATVSQDAEHGLGPRPGDDRLGQLGKPIGTSEAKGEIRCAAPILELDGEVRQHRDFLS